MNGIIVLNKPTGLSSHDCVNRVRKTFQTKKVGHAGTLDKEASGVLVLGINQGTKIMEFLTQNDKGYMFTLRFNRTTTTLDHAGDVCETADVHDFSALDATLKAFLGAYHQTPPAYSAVKVDGKKLYQYALENKSIPEVSARKTYIYTIKRLSNVRDHQDGTYSVDLFAETSKGVFVRRLADDIARRLGSVGHTTRIHRTQSGQFSIEDATELVELTQGRAKIISLNDALCDLRGFKVSESMKTRILNGQAIKLDSDDALIKLLDKHEQLLGIYKQDEPGIYKAQKVFH